MINVTEPAASKISGAAGRREQGRGRSARVRAGRRLLGLPVRLMIDEGEGDAATDQIVRVERRQAVRRSDQRRGT